MNSYYPTGNFRVDRRGPKEPDHEELEELRTAIVRQPFNATRGFRIEGRLCIVVAEPFESEVQGQFELTIIAQTRYGRALDLSQVTVSVLPEGRYDPIFSHTGENTRYGSVFFEGLESDTDYEASVDEALVGAGADSNQLMALCSVAVLTELNHCELEISAAEFGLASPPGDTPAASGTVRVSWLEPGMLQVMLGGLLTPIKSSLPKLTWISQGASWGQSVISRSPNVAILRSTNGRPPAEGDVLKIEIERESRDGTSLAHRIDLRLNANWSWGFIR